MGVTSPQSSLFPRPASSSGEKGTSSLRPLRTSIRAIAYGDMEHPADREDFVMHRALLETMLDGSYFSS